MQNGNECQTNNLAKYMKFKLPLCPFSPGIPSLPGIPCSPSSPFSPDDPLGPETPSGPKNVWNLTLSLFPFCNSTVICIRIIYY